MGRERGERDRDGNEAERIGRKESGRGKAREEMGE